MKKLLIFIHTEWAFGQLHRALANELSKSGWETTLKDWGRQYPHEEFADWIKDHTHFMTLCESGAISSLVSYGVPREKMIIVAHAECDIQSLIASEGPNAFHRFARYGVVGDSLACSSLALGVTRIPTVLRMGVEFERFKRPIAEKLTTVGYATLMERKTNSGVEQKRGALAQACAEAAGLKFKPVEKLTMDEMPDFYASIAAYVFPSLQEGSPLPPLEAAARGALVIGTPAGHFPRLAYEGLGIMGPLNEDAFLKFATEELIFYRDHPVTYRERCKEIQEAAQGRDWSRVVGDWLELLEQPDTTVRPLPVTALNQAAVGYVGTLPNEGLAQLEILKSLGCRPHHHVLEIGCGALIAGFPVMQYLEDAHYSGIDPNAWLVQESLRVLAELHPIALVEKKPRFTPRSDFRSGQARKFDFILAHSILSHTSDAQLTDFLAAVAEQIAPDGQIAASIRLAEGNAFGSPGSAEHGPAFREWQYPGVSWFRESDVVERARSVGLSCRVVPEFTRMIVQADPGAVHDWLILRLA